MRKHIVLITMLILWASAASCALSDESVGLDILGSSVNNTTITSPDGMPIEVDIIGSTATNIQIGYPTGEVNEDLLYRLRRLRTLRWEKMLYHTLG